ncbi:hypothetical protein OF83DRAFT_258647 [Amylostereum chailletii]|nr:hypothetical protein OF83DRAFT_258647 [Amylostereum chailletii]
MSRAGATKPRGAVWEMGNLETYWGSTLEFASDAKGVLMSWVWDEGVNKAEHCGGRKSGAGNGDAPWAAPMTSSPGARIDTPFKYSPLGMWILLYKTVYAKKRSKYSLSTTKRRQTSGLGGGDFRRRTEIGRFRRGGGGNGEGEPTELDGGGGSWTQIGLRNGASGGRHEARERKERGKRSGSRAWEGGCRAHGGGEDSLLGTDTCG